MSKYDDAHSGEYNSEEKWRPTKDFLYSTDESAEIMDWVYYAKEVVEGLHELGPDEDASEYLTALEIINGRLIEFGIFKDMNTGLPKHVYRENPFILAQWYAGQLFDVFDIEFQRLRESGPTLQEFSPTGFMENEEGDDDSLTGLVELNDVTRPILKDLQTSYTIFNMLPKEE